MNSQFRVGWWSLALYLTLGIVLEAFHGLKLGWYLDAGNETRRLMFTLGHAHGTLLALVNLAAGAMPRLLEGFQLPRGAGGALTGATAMLPLGFFLGGISVHGGDPGFGIVLVPIGAVLLLYGVVRIACAVSRFNATSARPR